MNSIFFKENNRETKYILTHCVLPYFSYDNLFSFSSVNQDCEIDVNETFIDNLKESFPRNYHKHHHNIIGFYQRESEYQITHTINRLRKPLLLKNLEYEKYCDEDDSDIDDLIRDDVNRDRFDNAFERIKNLEHLKNRGKCYQNVRSFKNLKYLEYPEKGGEFNAEDINSINSLETLIVAASCVIVDKDLEKFINLKHLELREGNPNYLTDRAFRNLSRIEYLVIAKDKKLTGKIFEYLPKLKHLELSNSCEITNEDSQRAQHLIFLTVTNCKNIDESVKKYLPNLKKYNDQKLN